MLILPLDRVNRPFSVKSRRMLVKFAFTTIINATASTAASTRPEPEIITFCFISSTIRSYQLPFFKSMTTTLA